jgi:hypothetical protein
VTVLNALTASLQTALALAELLVLHPKGSSGVEVGRLDEANVLLQAALVGIQMQDPPDTDAASEVLGNIAAVARMMGRYREAADIMAIGTGWKTIGLRPYAMSSVAHQQLAPKWTASSSSVSSGAMSGRPSQVRSVSCACFCVHAKIMPPYCSMSDMLVNFAQKPRVAGIAGPREAVSDAYCALNDGEDESTAGR